MKTSTAWKLVGIGVIGSLTLVGGSAFADVLYDCSLVSISDYNAIDALKLNIQAPLTKDDMQGALSDLKAYCCQIGAVTNDCDSAKQSTSNPESPYIFDQLVSRGFFKLDNKIAGSQDAKASAWEEKLTKWEENGKGTVPVGIQNSFIEAWQPVYRYSPRLNESSCAIENYDSLALGARYTAACMQSSCITRKFFLATSDLDNRYDEANCEAMARKRISDEMTYVQTLMVRKSNTFMTDVWQTYTQSYLLETRRGTLINKFSSINESFSAVNGKVQEGTRMCSG